MYIKYQQTDVNKAQFRFSLILIVTANPVKKVLWQFRPYLNIDENVQILKREFFYPC